MNNTVYECENKDMLSVNSQIAVLIGQNDHGNLITQDISSIPHFLICGFSGSGKTSFIQNMLIQICKSQSSETVKLFIYDSKAIDYAAFNGVPHLLIPVITEERRAVGMISWLNTEVQCRISAFNSVGVRTLESFNQKCNDPKPRIFAVLDDFSSARTDKDTVAKLISVLRFGRTVGIHCILATSTPAAIERDIMSNLPCRISFCVSNCADSRTVIGQNGAESLQVPGEMIFKYQNILAKCKATHIPSSDIQTALKNV